MRLAERGFSNEEPLSVYRCGLIRAGTTSFCGSIIIRAGTTSFLRVNYYSCRYDVVFAGQLIFVPVRRRFCGAIIIRAGTTSFLRVNYFWRFPSV